jgi:oxygen-independent coproporphyrinogen III oxidase
VQQSEELEPLDRAQETAVLMLRVTEGIERGAFRRQTGYDLDAITGRAIGRFVRRGLLEDRGDRVRLTREGKFLADSVFQAFLEE